MNLSKKKTETNINNLRLFSGIRIRFSDLNQSEKTVCLLITLIPIWWLWGWSYLLVFFALYVFAYELKQTSKISLNKPSLTVIFAFCFGFYTLITNYFYLEYNDIAVNPRQILGIFNSWIAPTFLLWYIQSKKVRIRLQVVAWGFSVVILQMLIVFFVSLFIYQQRDYIPLQSIFGLITGKSTAFEHGLGNSNYLIPYFATDESFIPGLVRYVFFFHGPESLGLVAGFIALLALDLKHRTWSLLLFTSSYFISLLSGTRSASVALLLVFVLRYIVTIGKAFGIALVLALMATVSFSTFSLPLTSNIVFDRVEQSAQAVAEARADSTEGRGKIYSQTWEGIIDASNTELFWGHKVVGENVTAYATAKIGSHSFYLSTLLYRSGVIGTIIFLLYWSSLILWFYHSQTLRPLCCLMILVLFSLTFCVMELEMPVMPIILICSMLRKSQTRFNSLNKIHCE